jgi:hypothetical protein
MIYLLLGNLKKRRVMTLTSRLDLCSYNTFIHTDIRKRMILCALIRNSKRIYILWVIKPHSKGVSEVCVLWLNSPITVDKSKCQPSNRIQRNRLVLGKYLLTCTKKERPRYGSYDFTNALISVYQSYLCGKLWS